MQEQVLIIAQITVPVVFTLMGAGLMMWRNQTQIMGELTRIHDILDLRLTTLKEQISILEARISSLEGFQSDIYKSGVMSKRQ